MAMILLKGSRAGALDAYEETRRALVEKFPGKEAWGIIARADHVMRSELWERTRRHIEKDRKRGAYLYRFNEDMPWEAVIRDSANNRDFWTDNVRDIISAVRGSGPPTLRSMEEAALDFGADIAASGPGPSAGVEAASRPAFPGGAGGGAPRGDRPPAKRRKKSAASVKKAQDRRMANGTKRKDGRRVVDEDGHEICFQWNRTPAGCVNGKCPNGRVHKCEFCLVTEHRTCGCPAHPGWKPGVPK